MNTSLKKQNIWIGLLVSLMLLGVVLVVSGSVIPGALAPNEQDNTTAVSNDPDDLKAESNVSSDEYKIYQNDEFGFSFAYPNDWVERVPEFGSPISLFNMSIRPAGYEGIGEIVINITPKHWIEEAMKKMDARGVVFEEILIADRKAYTTEDKDRISRPSTITLVLVDDEFWIDITGVKGNEEVYTMILDSFVIE